METWYCVKFSAETVGWISALSSNGKKPKVGCFYRFYAVYWIPELVISPKNYYYPIQIQIKVLPLKSPRLKKRNLSH